MDNHYHLALETRESNLSLAIRQVNGPYTQQFNRRHNSVGHLFQGRYKSVLVQKEEYLLELCRYIVLNPVRARLVGHPSDWKWSSFLATSGRSEPPEFLMVDGVLELLSSGISSCGRREAQQKYEGFVSRGMTESKAVKAVSAGKAIIGSAEFLARFKDDLKKKAPISEIPRRERFAARPKLANIFADAVLPEGMGAKAARNVQGRLKALMYEAHVEHGYLMKEIAAHLGVHYSTVSRAVREVEERSCKPLPS